jgi:hypothetical protein
MPVEPGSFMGAKLFYIRSIHNESYRVFSGPLGEGRSPQRAGAARMGPDPKKASSEARSPDLVGMSIVSNRRITQPDAGDGPGPGGASNMWGRAPTHGSLRSVRQAVGGPKGPDSAEETHERRFRSNIHCLSMRLGRRRRKARNAPSSRDHQ